MHEAINGQRSRLQSGHEGEAQSSVASRGAARGVGEEEERERRREVYQNYARWRTQIASDTKMRRMLQVVLLVQRPAPMPRILVTVVLAVVPVRRRTRCQEIRAAERDR